MRPVVRGREVYSAKAHSRGIDSGERGQACRRGRGGKLGGQSCHPRKVEAPNALCAPVPNAFGGRPSLPPPAPAGFVEMYGGQCPPEKFLPCRSGFLAAIGWFVAGRSTLQRRIVAASIVESEARPAGGVVVESLGGSPVIPGRQRLRMRFALLSRTLSGADHPCPRRRIWAAASRA